MRRGLQLGRSLLSGGISACRAPLRLRPAALVASTSPHRAAYGGWPPLTQPQALPLPTAAMSTTTTTAPAPLTVTKNGAPYVHDSDTFELHDFLASLEHAVYVTARTIDQTRVVELDAHIERLAHSSQVQLQGRAVDATPLDAEAVARVTSAEQLRPVVLANVASALQQFSGTHPSCDDRERRIKIIINLDSPDDSLLGFTMYTLVEVMPPPPPQPITVTMRGLPPSVKHVPGAKDSEWVRQRDKMEEKKAGAEELVFTDEDGNVCEGLQTNFFIVMHDRIITSEDDKCLPGTVRRILLDVCKENDIPVFKKTLNMATYRDWQSAFITSTSRLVLPITNLDIHPDAFQGLPSRPSEPETMTFAPWHSVVSQVKDLVVSHLREHSVQVL